MSKISHMIRKTLNLFGFKWIITDEYDPGFKIFWGFVRIIYYRENDYPLVSIGNRDWKYKNAPRNSIIVNKQIVDNNGSEFF